MNKIISTFCLISLLNISIAAIPTVKEQLESLNKGWKYKNFEDPALNERIIISNNEVKFIQFHLTYVEQKLREANISHLNKEQKMKRLDALNFLHEYMIKGIFPQNLYHAKRTPYFIDHLGTACAVGYLIIKTGNKELADKISFENNNDYIYELDLKYVQLRAWADEYGFTLDELAWIQPGYISCDTICDEEVFISAFGGVPPYIFLWNLPVIAIQNHSIMQQVYLCPGKMYVCTIIDSNGDTIPEDDCTISHGNFVFVSSNSITIPFHGSYIYTTKNNATLSCNGNATVYATNYPPHDYKWYFFDSGWQWLSDAQVIGNLCAGQYKVVVTNSANCTNTVNIDINSVTDVDEVNTVNINIYPNPSNDVLIVSGIPEKKEVTRIEIIGLSGEISTIAEVVNNNMEIKIPIRHLSPGIYNVRITMEEGLINRKIIKK